MFCEYLLTIVNIGDNIANIHDIVFLISYPGFHMSNLGV